MSFLLHCTEFPLPRQLSDVAEGLNYLHSCNVIHENLKGVRDYSGSRFTTVLTSRQSNVLVDAAGHAQLTDFGLSAATQDMYTVRNASGEHDHSVRWIAPEILDDRSTYSKGADVFSFAMVTIEVRCSQPTRGRYLRPKYHSSEQRFSLVPPRLVTNHIVRPC